MSPLHGHEMYEMDTIALHPHPASLHPAAAMVTGHQLTPMYPVTIPVTVDIDHQPPILGHLASAYPSPQPVYGTVVYSQPMVLMDPAIAALSFEDRQIKMDYIRKVLGVLFSQIGICFLLVNLFNLRTIKDWTLLNLWFIYVVLVISIVIISLLACFAESHQDCPVNIMLTGLFTFFASMAIGSASTITFSDASINLIYYFDVTLIISFALIFSLILFAFQASYDFNLINCIKYVVLIVTVFVIIYSILIIAWSNWLALFLPTVAYSTLCGLAFALYVIADITFMIQRSFYNGLTPSSVMLAIIYLHTDIINPAGNFWTKC